MAFYRTLEPIHRTLERKVERMEENMCKDHKKALFWKRGKKVDLIVQLAGWLGGYLVYQTLGWVVGCQAVWLAGKLYGWLVGWLASWLVDWLVDCLVVWLADWVVGWLVGQLASWLPDWLVDWLAGCLVDWLVGRLVG